MEVIWKRLIYHSEDLGDYYLISNTGEIKGIKTGKIRKKNINHEGYYFVNISLGSRDNKISIKIHRAVAETFLKNENNYPIINHKDGNKLNNNADNLEWCTYKQNTEHAIKNNLFDPSECSKRNKHNKPTNCRKIMSVENKECYGSIIEAARKYNSSNPETGRKKITRALLNNSTAYEMHWIYI